jgi:hypothetical protein
MLLDFLKPVASIIDKVIPDPNQAAQVKLQMFEMAQNGELEKGRQDTEVKKEQSAIIQAEIKSDSWLARNCRPIIMLDVAFILTYTLVIAPQLNAMGYHIVIPPLTREFWTFLELTVGGYVALRGVHKTAVHVVDAMKK